MKAKILIIGIAILGVLNGCYYDVEEVLYPTASSCDTIDISYNTDVQPIIQSSCYTCHDQASSFGNITLEGYANIKVYADNGLLLGVIRHESGFSPMPKSGNKLLDCEIATIEKWISDGALNN